MRRADRSRLGSRWFAAIAAAGLCLCALAAGPAPAAARGKWVVKGAGYGHGVGMSQYGAYGFAKRGFGYASILAHYYTGTTIGTTAPQTVRVLLLPSQSRVRFRGATAACGSTLTETKTYVVRRKGAGVSLRAKTGAKIARCGALLSATGGDTVEVIGKGTYRGALEVQAASIRGKLNAVNAVDLESYVRGVVPRESPASWPPEALKAQAVAARSFAIANPVSGSGFDQYDDTRSQAYGGAAAETSRTNQAVTDTASQVVLYQGEVAQTFFFSTSGGMTENNENVYLGGTPEPYLRGVPDPYEGDVNSAYHQWTRKFSAQKMQAALGDRVRGRLKNIVVTKRGVSPRIVKASLVGTGGTTRISGPDLKARLALPDSWAYFTRR
jgi:SpoIID/LytB domain protein